MNKFKLIDEFKNNTFHANAHHINKKINLLVMALLCESTAFKQCWKSTKKAKERKEKEGH